MTFWSLPSPKLKGQTACYGAPYLVLLSASCVQIFCLTEIGIQNHSLSSSNGAFSALDFEREALSGDRLCESVMSWALGHTVFAECARWCFKHYWWSFNLRWNSSQTKARNLTLGLSLSIGISLCSIFSSWKKIFWKQAERLSWVNWWVGLIMVCNHACKRT